MSHSLGKKFVLSIIVGLGIIAITSLVAFQLNEAAEREIALNKERIKELTKSVIELNARQLDVVSGTIIGFYLGSQEVTTEEFQAFTTQTINELPSLANMAVVKNEVVIQSYPITKYVGLAENIFENPVHVEDNEKKVIILNEDKDAKLTTILLVNPKALVPFDKILVPPYKVILYVNNEEIFQVQNESDKNMLKDSVTSLEVLVPFEFEDSAPQKDINFRYVISDSLFENRSFDIQLIIILLGFVLAIIISILVYYEMKNREIIERNNKELELNSTMLKKMQKLLLESEERYRNLFELSPLPVIVLDLHEKILSYNSLAADQFGFTKDEAVGQNFTEFVSDEHKKELSDLFKEVLSSGVVKDTIFACKRKDNTTFAAKLSVSAIRDKNAEISGIICIVSPLTESS